MLYLFVTFLLTDGNTVVQLCWKVLWHSIFWRCEGIAYGCLFGRICVLQYVLPVAGYWMVDSVMGRQFYDLRSEIVHEVWIGWWHGYSTFTGWTLLRFRDRVTLCMWICLVHHHCGIDVIVCVSLSLRLFDLLIVSLFLPPAFIPPRPFSGPPHIPWEDALLMWLFVLFFNNLLWIFTYQ